MSDTLDAERNGHTPQKDPKGVPLEAGGAPRVLPEKTKVEVDLNHRVMVEEYIGWYYPGVKPSLDLVVNEMIGIAWGRAKNDPQRPETPEERRARLTGTP